MKLEITKFDHFGRGIAKNNEKIVFVNRALPNEIVDAFSINEKKKYQEAKIKRIIKESDNRILPVCPYYKKCGGCTFLHTTYQHEKEFKKNKALELLGQCDNFYDTKKMNYRNKVTLHVDGNKIGLFEEKTKNIVKIDYCYLLNEKINMVISDLKKIQLSNYLIKKIIIKEANKHLLLDVDGEVDNKFIAHFPYVDTILSKNKIVKGNGYLEEKIDNKIFKITSNAFFQVNKDGLNYINNIIKNFLRENKISKVLDLYSGTSLWGILVSDYVKSVVSIELNKEACKNAQDNIEKNSINNIKVINGKVEDFIDSFNDIDLIIVDPPRNGLDKKTRSYLKKIGSKYIIYISCDMQTLKRDLEELKEKYNVSQISLVDMFKRTYHVESVCLLSRKTVDK